MINFFLRRKFIRHLLRSQRGIAAMEFALTLPIWVIFLLGLCDGTFYMLKSEKTDRIAYSVTDIVTQYQAISLSNLNDIVLAASQLMLPFQFSSNGVIIITSIYQPPGGSPTICWQYSGGGTLLKTSQFGTANGSPVCANGSPATLPSGLTLNDNDNVIISEVYYSFSPLFMNDTIFPPTNIYRLAVYKPRLSLLIQPPT